MTPVCWKCCDRILEIGTRPLVMGIVNVTPDSFSDGGQHADPASAIAHGMQLVDEGADILDVGGESTRPGAESVTVDEECARVVPVVAGLVEQAQVSISIDTTKAVVARAALDAGAVIVNDVSACTADPEMAGVVAAARAGVVLMHMRGTPRTMQDAPQYDDVVREVAEYLRERAETLEKAGVGRANMALDPGIGFGKTVEHNVALLAGLDVLVETGLPVLVGLSRKRFIGSITGREVEGRLSGSLAALTFAVLKGAHIMRVHDVGASLDAVKMAARLGSERSG